MRRVVLGPVKEIGKEYAKGKLQEEVTIKKGKLSDRVTPRQSFPENPHNVKTHSYEKYKHTETFENKENKNNQKTNTASFEFKGFDINDL